jgi:hypothetical protein
MKMQYSITVKLKSKCKTTNDVYNPNIVEFCESFFTYVFETKQTNKQYRSKHKCICSLQKSYSVLVNDSVEVLLQTGKIFWKV